MSAEDTQAFFARLEADAALQDKARAVQSGPADERVAGLTALAAELGLNVTAADLQEAGAEAAGEKLSEKALGGVVGGLGCQSPGLGIGNSWEGPQVPLG